MKWVSVKSRKPKESGYYYWKGKSGYGGLEFYDVETGEFEFNDDIPVNKVDEEHLFWLDEENDEYEE